MTLKDRMHVALVLAVLLAVKPALPAQEGSIIGWGDQVVGGDLDSGLVAVAGGWYHSLGLKADGSIVAWGVNGDGQCNVPEPNSGFVAVAGGAMHSLGVKADGSIAAWGSDSWGMCNVPEPNTGFVALGAGHFHSLGLKADGSIVAWGYNWTGQCNVPEPNSGFVAVAAGTEHSLGLKADGSIVAWGWNDDGQCNVPEPNTGFVAIAGGRMHSLGLKLSPLNPPTDLVATGGIQQVSLTWLTPTAGNLPTGYEVFRDYAKIGDVTAPTTSYVDDDPSLVPGTEYCYKVKSVAGDLKSGRSNVSCGTPMVPPSVGPFIRGDCNGDGSVSGEVTDAVFLLNYNFIGGGAPPCFAACDINGDGEFVGMVSDAVYILNFNFLGGVPPPPAPFPGCGLSRLETDVALGCETPTAAGKCP